MMILRLWTALRQPRYDKHPIFRRILLEPDRRIRLPRRIFIAVGILFGMLLLCLLTYIVPATRLSSYAVLPLVLPILFVAFALGGTGKGIGVASEVSNAISQEYERDTFQTLATLPGGKLGIYWMILTAFVHRGGNLENTHEFQKQITGVAFGMASFLLIILYMNTWTDLALSVFVDSVFVLYPLVAIYYIDYVCAFVTSALVGAVAASITQRGLEARLTSVVGFLIVQFGSLALTYYLAVRVIPTMIAPLEFNIWLARLALAGGSMVVYVAIREIIVWLLWWGLGLRLGAQDTEQEAIFDL